MPIFNAKDDREKLRLARKEFDRTAAHYQEYHVHAKRYARFYHNTNGEGQWDPEDLEVLRDENRTILSLNVIAAKINQIVGLHQDSLQQPVLTPADPGDQAKADVLNTIRDRLKNLGDFNAKDQQTFGRGMVMGEGDTFLDVRPDPQRPGFFVFERKPVSALEIMWDPDSEQHDRSDAKFFYWNRWLAEGEFMREFPDKTNRVDELRRAQEDPFSPPDSLRDSLTSGDLPAIDHPGREDDYRQIADSRWYDKRRRRLRVVHLEYTKPVRRAFIADTRTGQTIKATPEQARIVDQVRQGPLRSFLAWDEEVWWFEFIANDVLYDEASPMPYDGFSVTPFVAYMDEDTRQPYGPVHNLLDPQKEVNRGHSQSLDHLSAQAKPGWISEESAISDVDQFESQNRTSGGVAIVEDGALTSQRIQERKIPTYGEAAAKRLETGMALFDRISNIQSDAEVPARNVEAAVTQQLRHRKTLLGLVEVMNHYHQYQRSLAKKETQAILRVMGNQQMLQLLGNAARYQAARPGILIDLQNEVQIDLTDVRTFDHDLELQAATENHTERLFLLQMLSALSQAGTPVDPTVMLELAAPNRAMRERLVNFARSALEAQAQGQQLQAQEVQAQVAASFADLARKRDTEQFEAQEEARHNRISEVIDLLGVLEKADANEKQQLLDLKNMIEQRQQRRAASNGSAR